MGVSEMTTKEWQQYLTSEYEYRTEHQNEAGAYSVLIAGVLENAGYDSDDYTCECPDVCRFVSSAPDSDVVRNADGTLSVYVYLGNDEMELSPSACGLEPPTPEQIEEIASDYANDASNWGWVDSQFGGAFYQQYPQILVEMVVSPWDTSESDAEETTTQNTERI